MAKASQQCPPARSNADAELVKHRTDPQAAEITVVAGVQLKCSRRLATRYDKTSASYLGFIHIAAARLWTNQFVNRA